MADAVRHDDILVASRHAISPRDLPINITMDKLNCGKFNTANYWDIMDLLNAMKPSQPDDCTTPAKTCRRVACVNTSGVYVRPTCSLTPSHGCMADENKKWAGLQRFRRETRAFLR